METQAQLLKDKVALGGEAAATAGPVGRNASAETNATMRAEILTYAKSRGLFAGIFLVGLETIKMIQNKISQNVRKTVKSTYNHAKKLPGIIKRKKWQRRH